MSDKVKWINFSIRLMQVVIIVGVIVANFVDDAIISFIISVWFGALLPLPWLFILDECVRDKTTANYQKYGFRAN